MPRIRKRPAVDSLKTGFRRKAKRGIFRRRVVTGGEHHRRSGQFANVVHELRADLIEALHDMGVWQARLQGFSGRARSLMDQIKPAVSNAHRICRVNHRLASDVIRNRLADLLFGSPRRCKKDDVCPTRDVANWSFGWVRGVRTPSRTSWLRANLFGQRGCNIAPSNNSNLHAATPCLAVDQDIWVGEM